MKTLLAAGAASQEEMEQAQTALDTSEAQLKALEAQIRQQRVSSPTTTSRRRRRGSSATSRCASATA